MPKPAQYPIHCSNLLWSARAMALTLMSASIAANVSAQSNVSPEAVAHIQRSITAFGSSGNADPTPARISPSAIASLYTVVMGADIGYMTADGRYLVRGEIIDLQAKVNLTELETKKIVSGIVNSIDRSELIHFAPEKPAYTVIVFTDIDCTYCRRLHGQIAEYNKLGIAVQYAAFPRAGRDSHSFAKAVSVWCSDDRASAITRAKSGAEPELKTCVNPVGKHLDIAEMLHFEGTPTMVLPDGSVIPGYLDSATLAARLQPVAAVLPESQRTTP